MNTNAYIDDILTPALRELEKHFKNRNSPSNRTVLPLTPPTEPKNGAWTIFLGFGARDCGLPHCLISTQWTSVCGPCWETEACRSTHKTVEALKVSLVKA